MPSPHEPPPAPLADVRRDVRTVLYSADPAALGPAIVRLEKWAEAPEPETGDANKAPPVDAR